MSYCQQTVSPRHFDWLTISDKHIKILAKVKRLQSLAMTEIDLTWNSDQGQFSHELFTIVNRKMERAILLKTKN